MASTLKIYGNIVQDKVSDSDVTATSVKDFVEGLDKNEELNVHINSYGGFVDVGLSIYQTIKSHKGKTTVYIDGFACSIASIISFAGDELVVPESSLMMIHLPYIGTVGNKIELQKKIDALENMEKSLMAVYTNNLRDKSDEQTIKDFLYEEKWFDANEINKYFKVTLKKDETSSKAAAKLRVIPNSSSDTYKQEMIKKYTSTEKISVAKTTNERKFVEQKKAAAKKTLTSLQIEQVINEFENFLRESIKIPKQFYNEGINPFPGKR